MNETPIDPNQTFALEVSTADPFVHLRKARHHLERAEKRIADSRLDTALLDAHLAVYHAVRAYIAAKTGKPSRTPRRIHMQFARLVTLAHDIPPSLQKSVSRSLKALSLYQQGEASKAPSIEIAGTVGQAQTFITLVAASLPIFGEQGADLSEIRIGHG